MDRTNTRDARRMYAPRGGRSNVAFSALLRFQRLTALALLPFQRLTALAVPLFQRLTALEGAGR